MKVLFEKIERGGRVTSLPRRQTSGSAGADLAAFLDEPVVLSPGERALIPTGLRGAIPEGFAGFVMARSGLSVRSGITMANGVGLVDSDFRGEFCVPVVNLGNSDFTVTDGMRIAQLVIVPIADFECVEGELSATERGEGGFGSTGLGEKK